MKWASCVLVAVCLLPAAARAEPITLPTAYSQVPWDPEAGGAVSNHIHPDQVAADDFPCAGEEAIVAVRWWGGYSGETAVRAPAIVTFDICFYLSGLNVFGDRVPAGRVAFCTVQAEEVFVGYRYAQPIYRYEVMLPTPFDQWTFSQQSPNAGELWLSIDKPMPSEYWVWQSCVAPHPRLGYVQLLYGDHETLRGVALGTDLAFELIVAPEPATMALLGFGLVMMVGWKRRKLTLAQGSAGAARG